jgi:flagellar biosynthetic protein FliP
MRTDALVKRRWLKMRWGGWLARRAWVLCALCVLSAPAASLAQAKSAGAPADEEFPRVIADDRGPATGLEEPSAVGPPPSAFPGGAPGASAPIGGFNVPDLTKRENVSAALQLIVVLTILSLAPAILIMMTCFTRIIIVLSLLRQALGTQQLPPNQVLIGLALFMTFLVMGPTWQRVNNDALRPYLDGQINQPTALQRAQVPLREFMMVQIVRSSNENDVRLFAEFARQDPMPENIEDVGTMTLIPAFMLSELKTAFIMGFKVYLPFLIIDIVISTILISMGMMMLPPVMISLPFKLLLFVLVDGWHLITAGLMGSFGVIQ